MNNFSLSLLSKYARGHIHLFFYRSACTRPKRGLPGPNESAQEDCFSTVQPPSPQRKSCKAQLNTACLSCLF